MGDLALAVDQAKASVLLPGTAVTSIREAAVFMQAVGNLAASTKTLVELERKVYNIDSAQEHPKDAFGAFLPDLSARGSRLPIAGGQ